MLPAKDIMIRDMITISNELPILDAAQIMVDNNLSTVMITDLENNLIGVLSEIDVLRLLNTDTGDKSLLVDHFMSKNINSFDENVTALEACDYFFAHPGKHYMPVTRYGKLLGIIRRYDLVKFIVRLRKGKAAPSQGPGSSAG